MDYGDTLRAFVAVVDGGSFTEAAAHLQMSRAKVSAGSAELEARLGVVLLNRTTRHQSLTHEGKAYYKRALRILDEIDQAGVVDKENLGIVSGLLRIDASASGKVAYLK